MRYLLSTLLLLSTSCLFAAEVVPPSPRPPFPDDFVPSPCAAASCETFALDQLPDAAARFLGLTIENTWLDKHEAELLKLIEPSCRKRNTCIATPGNGHMFCDDLVTPELRTLCDRAYPKAANSHDWEQCHAYVEIWALGMTQRSLPPWKEAQDCAQQKGPPPQHAKSPDIWVAPDPVPSDYTGYLTFFAIDPDTHVPVFLHMSWEGQTIYAPSNPTGETASYYPFKGPFKLVRVPNAQGHEDVVPPLVTMKADYYPTTTFRLPMKIPKMVVEVKPDPRTLRPGKHTITVAAHDSETGLPVEAEVMIGSQSAGQTNVPITIERRKKEKLPEIWVTSLFDAYSDVVVQPAEK